MDGRKQEISLKMKNEFWTSESGFVLEKYTYIYVYICAAYVRILTYFFFLLCGHEHRRTICHIG
jgi:hypothetical protein